MPLQDSTNTQTRSPRRDVKNVVGRHSGNRGEGLSTLTPRVNDSSALNRVLRESARQSPERQLEDMRRYFFSRRLGRDRCLLRRRLGRDRCPECPKSRGSEACPKCSPLNFCFLTEHGNSSDDAMSKDMCPKCSPQNFCRDAEHGQSEESPAHKSSCVKCSPEYFGCVENPEAFRNPGSTRV